MRTGEQSNLDVNRDLRRALVMHWIDLGRLSIHTQNDRALIRGSLVKLPGADSPLTSASVDVVYKKLKSAAGFRRLQADFDNWSLNPATGTWEQSAARDKRHAEATDLRGKPAQASYRVDD